MDALSTVEQRSIMLDTSTLLERLAIRFNASIPIPMLSTLKHAISMLRTHANAEDA
jgi:hypothetical protein